MGMLAEAIDYRYVELERQKTVEREPHANLMTPARRAGLDALEQEFREFLRTQRR
jgi:hypothetical protein